MWIDWISPLYQKVNFSICMGQFKSALPLIPSIFKSLLASFSCFVEQINQQLYHTMTLYFLCHPPSPKPQKWFHFIQTVMLFCHRSVSCMMAFQVIMMLSPLSFLFKMHQIWGNISCNMHAPCLSPAVCFTNLLHRNTHFHVSLRSDQEGVT